MSARPPKGADNPALTGAFYVTQRGGRKMLGQSPILADTKAWLTPSKSYWSAAIFFFLFFPFFFGFSVFARPVQKHLTL